MKRLITLVSLALLCGCSAKYYHPDPMKNNARELERDKRRCMNEATIQAQAWGSAGNPFMILEDTKNCLELEYGWIRQ